WTGRGSRNVGSARASSSVRASSCTTCGRTRLPGRRCRSWAANHRFTRCCHEEIMGHLGKPLPAPHPYPWGKRVGGGEQRSGCTQETACQNSLDSASVLIGQDCLNGTVTRATGYGSDAERSPPYRAPDSTPVVGRLAPVTVRY